MFRKTTTLAARQRITPHAPRKPHPKSSNTDMGWMTTYSAFDPYSSRPLPLPMQSGMAMQMPTPSLVSTPPERHRGLENTKQEKKKKSKVVSKPWAYSLPPPLQPKDGTTFSLVNGTGTATHSKRTGLLQAILYGVPDPERFSYTREMVAPGSLLHKILHGVKEMDDGVGVVAVASVAAVKSGESAVDGGKAGKKIEAVVVVRNLEVAVEVENVLGKQGGLGQGVMAK